MLKKLSMIVIAFALVCGLPLSGIAADKITQLSQLNGKTVAVPKGTVADELVLSTLGQAKIVYFDTVKACVEAVANGLADAAAYDEPTLRSLMRIHKDMHILPEFITHDSYGFAVNLARIDLKEGMDKLITRFLNEGYMQDMEAYWFPIAFDIGPMHVIPLKGEKGTLRFGTSSVVEPFSFKGEGDNVVGFDIELAYYIAQELGMQLEVVDMPFNELIPALQADKVDMIGAGITITSAREQMVLFSVPYYHGGIAAAVLK